MQAPVQEPSPFAFDEQRTTFSTKAELLRHHVAQAKTEAAGVHVDESPFSASCRQLGVSYGVGVGLYLHLIVW